MSDPAGPVTARAKWNTAVVLTVLALVFYFAVCGWALFTEHVTFDKFCAIVGPLVGAIVGWVGRMLVGSE